MEDTEGITTTERQFELLKEKMILRDTCQTHFNKLTHIHTLSPEERKNLMERLQQDEELLKEANRLNH
jgi:hypothetical protein